MIRAVTVTSAFVLLTSACLAQNPIYRVTVISRTTKAINYDRQIPTKVDFRGSVLLPTAHGEATVESRRGSTVINAKFDHVDAPTRFGSQYLTYVVWAISPDGRPQNLGELVLNGSDKGKLLVSTNMQTFALIVTAEPDYAVTQPSDVVVMENAVRADTVGKVQEVDATYELLPRKGYTLDRGAMAGPPNGRSVSMDEYEATLALYQAKNAIQLAESQGAQQYAPERIAKARQLFDKASGYPKSLSKDILAMGREATQLAEDARTIATKRAEQERAAAAETQAIRVRAQAEADRQKDATLRNMQRAKEDADRAAAEVARAADAAQRASAQQPPPPPPVTEYRSVPAVDKSGELQQTRANLTAKLARILTTNDTPRGIVVTVPESMIGAGPMTDTLYRVAENIRMYPGLQVDVQGYTDREGQSANVIAEGYAESVRTALLRAGLPPESVHARGYGTSRLTASNATAAGREQNRRVEIVITGGVIGSAPSWDRSYTLAPPRRR